MDFTLTKEQDLLRRNIREFAARELVPIADTIEKDNSIPASFISRMAAAGLFGLAVEKKHGGAGQGFSELALAVEELARVCAASAMLLAVHYLAVIPIARNGTDEQKAGYLPGLAKGSGLGSFAFTEPGTGSDPRAILTVAKPDGDRFLLTGTKRFISNSPFDGPIVIFAKDAEGCTTFIGEKNTAGYSTPSVWDLMGLRGLKVADIEMKDWAVPAANVLAQRGKGFPILLDTIAVGKMNVSAMLLGVCETALDLAVKYAKEKTLRDKPIAGLLTIQSLIADMATSIEACRSMVYRLASSVDKGANIARDSAMTKLFVSESALEITAKAMQVQGAYSYAREMKTEKLHRDIMIGTTVEGANELQRVIIASTYLS